MTTGFWGTVWLSFRTIQGLTVALVGVGLSILVWIAQPSTSVPLSVLVPIGTACLLLMVTLGNAVYDLVSARRQAVLPTILAVRPVAGHGNIQTLVFLLEPSALFSFDTLVSFYYLDDDFETLLGVGRVQTIQDDGKVQVEMTSPAEGQTAVVEQLARSESRTLTRTRVKPHVPQSVLQALLAPGVDK